MVKILIIDDMDDMTFSIKKSLEDLDKNYEVVNSNTGKLGLELAEMQKPDVILLDIMMPDMSGWQVLDALKNNPATKNIPVIFLTAKEDELSKQMGERMADDYIIKPVKVEKIDKKIKSILS